MPSVLVVSYLIILWLMMPKFSEYEKERYVLYLFPIIIPFGLNYIYLYISKHTHYYAIKKYLLYCIYSSVIIYFTFTVIYSFDAINYLFSLNKKNWHKATWYYNDYDWINNNIELSHDKVILVITDAQQTYYLRKKYINGDSLSA